MLNVCVHRLWQSKCHFHITTVMSDGSDTYQQQKYANGKREKIVKMHSQSNSMISYSEEEKEEEMVARNQLWHKRCIKINTMDVISTGNIGIYLRLQCALSSME